MMKNKLSKRILAICLAATVMFTTVDSSLVYATESTTESSAEVTDTETDKTEEAGDSITAEEAGNDTATDDSTVENQGTEDKKDETESLSPAFDAETKVDDTKIHVTAPEGVFPEGCTVKAEKVAADVEDKIEDKIADTVEDKKNVAKSYTFDIKVLNKDGVEVQPNTEFGKVNVSFEVDEADDKNVTPMVYHVDNDYNVKELEVLDADKSEDDKKVSVETEGFSYYVIEFTYDSKQFVLNNDTEVKMNDVLKTVGLEGDVEKAESSNTDSLSVRQADDGTWYVKAESAFSSDETVTLKVTINGVEYSIAVTKDYNLRYYGTILTGDGQTKEWLIYRWSYDYYNSSLQPNYAKIVTFIPKVTATYAISSVPSADYPTASQYGRLYDANMQSLTVSSARGRFEMKYKCEAGKVYYIAIGGYSTVQIKSAVKIEHQHIFDDMTVTKEATCTEEGSKEKICPICGENVIEAIPALGHDLDEDGVCTRCGVTPLHAILYSTGELHFQYGKKADSSKGSVVGKYLVEDSYSSYSAVPWYSKKYSVKSVTSDKITCPTSMAYWFYENSIKSIDLSNFDTSKVTDMHAMFESCNSLTSVDLSNLDTSNVTDMSYMFCNNIFNSSSLKSIDLSGLNTSKVTNMKAMFSKCDSLTNINLNGLDLSSVTDMSSMFFACNSLTDINLSNVNTSNVTNMNAMFRACRKLTSIDLSDLDTGNVIDMNYMFSSCEVLKSVDLSNFDTGKVANMNSMFNECKALKSVSLSGLDTSNVTSMSSMFYGCSSLTSIDLSKWDTSNVTSMSSMFYGCSSLMSINLSGLDTNNVTTMDSMFYNCSSLVSIDLSSLDTSNVTSMSSMFSGCKKLGTITLGEKWKFVGSTNYLPASSWTQESTGNIIDPLWTKYDGATMAGTYVTVCAILYENGELHFQYGLEPDESKGEVLFTSGVNDSYNGEPPWASKYKYIKSVKADDPISFKSMSHMFDGCSYLETVDFTNFDTSNVTDMSYMFENCNSLKGVDFSKLDTSNVTDMSYMFRYCFGLKNVDMDLFDLKDANTSKVTNMSNMFYNCSALESIDLTGLDTSNVTDLSRMFSGCKKLESVNISDLDTSNVTNMSNMFYDCNVLTSVDLNDLNTGSVTNMSNMFYNCKALINIEAKDVDISNVTDMSNMFYECNKLKKLDVSKWNTGNVTTMNAMFYHCYALKDLDVSKWNTGNVTTMNSMFYGGNFTELDVSNWDTSKCSGMDSMFYYCEDLIDLDVSKWDTSNVTDMESMFYYCRKLTNLDVSNWNTDKVYYMKNMFYYCDSLRYLDLSNWSTSRSSSSNMSSMFYNCNSLVGIKLGAKWSFNGANCLPKSSWVRYSTKETINPLYSKYDGATMADTYCQATKCKFNANGGLINKTVSCYIPDKFGEDVVVDDPVRWGYTFNGWYDSVVGGNKLNEGDSLTHAVYYAHWISNNYVLTLKSNGTDEEDITIPMKSGSFYQLTADKFHKSGYVLSGWNSKRNGSGEAFAADAYVGDLIDDESGEYILYAQWTPESRYATVSFETDGGSAIKSYQVLKGSQLGKLSKSLKENYTFINWHINSLTGTVADSSTVIDDDVVLYAEFKKDPTVTFDGTGQVANETRCVQYSKAIGKLPTYKVSKDCPMTFVGWFTEKNGGEEISADTVVTEDVTYYAHWGWKPNFNVDGGKIISDIEYPLQESADYRFADDIPGEPERADITHTPGYNYCFVQNGQTWTSNNQNKNNTTAQSTWTFEVPANSEYEISYSVSSEQNYDKLTISLDGNTIVSGISGTYSGNYTIPSGNHTLVAQYSKDSSQSKGDDQAVITLPDIIVPGANIDRSLPTAVKDGYEFIGWFVNDGKTEIYNGDTVDLSKNPEILAKWKRSTIYTVSLDVNSGVWNYATELKAVDGVLRGLNEPTRQNYKFLGWMADDGTYYKNGDTVTSDLKLTAQWRANSVTVTFDPAASVGTGSMYSKTKTIAAGTSINTLPGAKLANYYLEGWYTEKDGKGEKLTEDTIINENVTYYAFYKPILNPYETNGFSYTFGAEWTNVNTKEVDNYNNNLEWHYTGDRDKKIVSSLHLRYELNKADGTNVLQTGAVQIKVPKYIWKDWDNKWTGTNDLSDSIPRYPNKRSGIYFSYIDGSNANSYSFLQDVEDASDYYYLVNNQPISGGTGFDLTIDYSAYAYLIPGGAMNYNDATNKDYIAGYNYYQGEVPIGVNIDTDYNINDTNAVYQADMSKEVTLTNELHTYVKPSYGTDGASVYYDWADSWGKKPEDSDDYFYVRWAWRAYHQSNTLYSYIWSENTEHDGTVVGWESYYDGLTENYDGNSSVVIMKYPKAMLINIPKDGLVLKNRAILKTTWKSGYEEELLAEKTVTIQSKDVVEGGFKKCNSSSSYSTDRVSTMTDTQKKLVNDEEVSLWWTLTYDSGSVNEFAEWDADKKTVNIPNRLIELVDGKPGDIMYSSGKASSKYVWEPSTGNVALNDNDYYIDSLSVYCTAYDAEYVDGTCINLSARESAKDYKSFKLYLRYANSDEFVYYNTYSFENGGRFGDEIVSYIEDLPSDAVGYKIQSESDYYRTYLYASADFAIKPTDHIKSLVNADYLADMTSIFKDQSECTVEWKDENKTGEILHENNNTGGKNDASGVIYEMKKSTPTSTDYQSDTYQYTKKTASSTPSVDVTKGVQDSYISIAGWNYTTNASEVTPITSGIFYDLLPVGTTVDVDTISASYITGNYEYSAGYIGGSTLTKELYHVRFEENWENSNRTMMIIDCNSPTGVKSAGFKFNYKLRNTFGNIVDNGTSVENDVAFVNTSSNRSSLKGKANGISTITDQQYYEFLTDDEEGAVFTTYASTMVNYRQVKAFGWGFNKSVKSDSTNGLYVQENATTSANNEYTYCLEFNQSDNAKSSNIVLYDVLEQGANVMENGQAKFVSSNWHGVLKDVNVAGIAKKYSNGSSTVKCDPVVYYSTKDRDSFTEADYDISKSDIWSSEKPSDLSTVTAIAIDCTKATDGSDFVFKNKDTLPVYVTMVAPNDENGFDKSAYNTATIYAKQGDVDMTTSLTSYSETVLKDLNPAISISTVPASGTAEKPTNVFVDTGINYELNVKNTDTGLPAKEVKVEYEVPEGLVLDYDNMKFALGNSSGELVSNSPAISVKKNGRKLTFVIKRLAAGQTGHIIIPTTVNVEDGLITASASITNVNGVDKNIGSNTTYHTVIQMPAENAKAKIKKVNRDGDLLAGATLQITGRGIYDSEDMEPIVWQTAEDETYEVPLAPGNYVLHEVSAPDGYVLNTNDISFEVKDEDVELEMFNSEDTTLQIDKEWNDGDDVDGRPDSVDFEIYQDGEYLKDVTVTKDADWKLTVTGLPKYSVDGDHDICKYTVKEKSDDYIAEYVYGTDLDKQSVKVINTKAKTIKGTKKWNDGNEDDINRPEDITVQLLQNGCEYKTQTVTAADEWKYEFAGIPMFDADGNEYSYTVKEAYMEGYSVAYESVSDNGIAVSLDYQTESTSYDWVYIYYYKDSQLYRSAKYGGSRSSITLNIPSSEFWLEFRSDSSSCSFYGVKVTDVQPLDYTPELLGSTVSSMPSGYTEIEASDWNEIETLPHGNYGNNVQKRWHYASHFGGGSSDKINIVNTKLTDDYTKVQFRKVDENDEYLANAHLQLLDTKGNVVQDWTTGAEYEMFNAIDPGDYVLHEEAAPDGYKVAADMDITIEDTTDIQTFTMVDKLDKGVNLSVSQIVSGSGGNRDKAFNFNLQLTDGDSYPAELQYTITEAGQDDVTGTMSLSDGVGSFTLKHGQTITFAEVPSGLHYEVHELDGESQGYTVNYTHESGTLEEDVLVNVANVRNVSVPTLAHMNTILPLALVILAIAGAAYVLRKRKKQV